MGSGLDGIGLSRSSMAGRISDKVFALVHSAVLGRSDSNKSNLASGGFQERN